MRSLSQAGFTKESRKSERIILVKLLVIVTLVVAVYWQDLDLVFRASLSNDFMSYILLVPFIVGYLIYRKRKMLKAVSSLHGTEQEKQIWTGQLVTGIILLAVSFLTYLFGSFTSRALEYHLLSLPLFVAGSIALMFNLETLKTLLFPIGLLFFIQPYLIELANPFWADLSWISSTAAYSLLTIIGVPAKFTTIIEVPTIEITTINGDIIPFTVGVASSGLNSFMGFTVFSVVVVYLLKGSLWKRITLMLVGYPLLISLNTLRITIILGLAYQWGVGIAEVFHLTGGIVLVFLGTVTLLLIGEKIWRTKISAIKPIYPPCAYCSRSLKSSLGFCVSCGRFIKPTIRVMNGRSRLKIIFVIFIVILLLLVQTPPIALANPPTEIDLAFASTEEFEQLLPTIPEWELQFLYRDSRVESILNMDAVLLFAYVSEETNYESPYTHAYIFVSVQISTGLHTWENSLITYPARYGHPTATVLDLRDVQILQNPTLTGRFFAYQRPESDRTEIVLYWFERVPFKIGSSWEMRNVLISILSYSEELTLFGLISNPNDFKGGEEVYLPMAQSIASYWEPIKTSSYITALISVHGDKVLIISGILLSAIAVSYALQKRRERKANTDAYRKLSEPDKRLIGSIHETETTTTPTLNAIAVRYQRNTGETINSEELLQKLVKAEEIGIIKRNIIHQYDEPILTWKTRV